MICLKAFDSFDFLRCAPNSSAAPRVVDDETPGLLFHRRSVKLLMFMMIDYSVKTVASLSLDETGWSKVGSSFFFSLMKLIVNGYR